MPSPEQIRATLDAYIRCFSAGDRAGWVDLFSDDAVQEDPVGSPVNQGHDAIGAFYDAMLAGGVPQLSFVREPVVCGDEALMFLMARTGSGDGEVRVPFIVDHVRLDEAARITSLRAFWDPASMEVGPPT
jgi:steroid delta-isomerase